MRNIYLLGSESTKSIVFAQGINRLSNQHNVIGVTRSGFSSKIFSKYFKSVLRFDDLVSLIPFLMKLKSGVDLVIPVTSEWARFVNSIDENLLPKNLIFQGTNFERLDNKVLFCATLESLSIRTPAILNSLQTLPTKRVVVKPVFGSSSKGVMYFDPSEKKWRDLENYKNSSTHLIQEFIEGFGAGVSGFCINGKSFSVYSHKRLLEWPIKGGSSSYRESFQSRELEVAFSIVARHFNWTGFLMLEAKIDRDGNPWIIEANPRIWGSFRQSIENTQILDEFISNEHCDLSISQKRTFHSPLGYLSTALGFFHQPLKSLRFILDTKKIPDISLFRDPRGWFSQFGR